MGTGTHREWLESLRRDPPPIAEKPRIVQAVTMESVPTYRPSTTEEGVHFDDQGKPWPKGGCNCPCSNRRLYLRGQFKAHIATLVHSQWLATLNGARPVLAPTHDYWRRQTPGEVTYAPVMNDARRHTDHLRGFPDAGWICPCTDRMYPSPQQFQAHTLTRVHARWIESLDYDLTEREELRGADLHCTTTVVVTTQPNAEASDVAP
jgi:hypothetical protein